MFSKKDPIFDKFWVPNRSRHKLKEFVPKTSCFLHFCNFPVESSRRNAILEWKLPGVGRSKMAKMVHMLDHKMWELST